MANPRRNSLSSNTQNSDSNSFNVHNLSRLSFLITFLKRPQAFPLLLSIFVFITWISLRLQHSDFSKSQKNWSSIEDDDVKANLVRFNSHFPSPISKDKRGWLFNPVSLALELCSWTWFELDLHRKSNAALGNLVYPVLGCGAVNCVSQHLGEIRPGAMRGNHRHYSVNETFIIWGAKTKFRLENNQIDDKGYAEVIVGAAEVAVAASPSGTAHALVNVDPVLSTFFIGCQDGVINNNNSTSDYNVWKDL
ncbi:hypothetical protein Pint_18361 [Pistacia integerrima]|uniref:Uncharacterized protein n=1 Tax=Pistacia integerrima TaxID=434235 RepID=A0ACC0YZR0_9ROSI|nr:hypothetical protein Pint_18361 [Pistacia integerrima]